MEERDSREGCRQAERSLLHWRPSRAQTAHCTILFIFIWFEVLGFSPALMEVGRAVRWRWCKFGFSWVRMCVLMWVCCTFQRGEGDERESDLCMDMKTISFTLVSFHFLSGTSFTSAHKTKLFVLLVCSSQPAMPPLFWICERPFETPEGSLYCLLFGAKSIHLRPLSVPSGILWSSRDLLSSRRARRLTVKNYSIKAFQNPTDVYSLSDKICFSASVYRSLRIIYYWKDKSI